MRFGLTILALLTSMALSGQGGIRVTGTGQVVMGGSPDIVIRDGGLRVDGTYTRATETITFSGTSADSIIGGTLTLYDVAVTNTGGITDSATLLTTNDLTISSGTGFTILPTSSTTIEGTLTNSGTNDNFLIESNASSTGSLISSTVGEPLQVERYMTENLWSIVSSQVSDVAIASFLSNSNNDISTKAPATTYAMAHYDETTDNWVAYYTDATTGSLTAGVAYELRRSTPGAVEFPGNSIGSSTSIAITRNNHGWNGLGNPFTSSIKIRGTVPGTDSFLGENADVLDPSYAAIYIWDQNNPSQYRILNNSETGGRYLDQDYIPPGQGFIVRSISGGGTVDFTSDMQSHLVSSTFYKKSAPNSTETRKATAKTNAENRQEWFPLIIHVSSADKTATARVLFSEFMTPGLDITYDAGLLGVDPDVKVFTRLVEDNGNNFAIQCLPISYAENMILPIGVHSNQSANITLDFEIERLPDHYELYMEDKAQEEFINLKMTQSGYSAVVNTGEQIIDRFFLHVQTTENATDFIEKQGKAQTAMYTHGTSLYIEPLPRGKHELTVINLQGRVVHSEKLDSFTKARIPLSHLENGIYLFRIIGETNLTGRHYLGD